MEIAPLVNKAWKRGKTKQAGNALEKICRRGARSARSLQGNPVRGVVVPETGNRRGMGILLPIGKKQKEYSGTLCFGVTPT